MPDTLLMLGFEHQNFAELLSLIDQQRRSLELDGTVDFGLLQSVAEYFGGYPDECHHPVEELVLQRLRVRDPTAMPEPDKLSEDHLEIARLTRLLAKTLRAAVSNGDKPAPDLARVMAEFVDRYRNHMSMEEEHFFPAATKTLTDEDWAEIDFSVFDRDDPLYDSSAHARFATLRNNIDKSAQEFGRSSIALRQMKRLRQLVSISDFNNAMPDRNCVLVRQPPWGYKLVLDGKTVLEIPDCNEQQAAWCAYFFLLGKETRGGRS